MSEVNDSSGSESTSEAIETQVEGQETQEVEAKPDVPAKNLKKFKYKVDGNEIEEEIDLNDEETIKKHLSMSKAAYKRMQEAAKIKQQNEQFIRMLQEDPLKVLTHEQFGGSQRFREIAENFLAAQLEEQMLSPEEKYRKEMEEKLKRYEEQEKEVKTKQEQEQMIKLQEHYAQDFEQKIVKGLSSQGIPKTARTVKRMAELMSKNLQHGLELEPEHLAEIVKQDYVNEMKEMFGAADGDILLKLLGDDVSNKIRKYDLQKLKNNAYPSASKKSVNESVKPEDVSRMSKEEWREWLNKRSQE